MLTVLLAAAEAAPFVKTGGLGDVVGSLAKALRRIGVDARVMLPQYDCIAPEYKTAMVLKNEAAVPVGWRRQYCGLRELIHDGTPFYFLDNAYYFRRPRVYGFFDEAERYAFFCRSVLAMLPALDVRPQILHCHDWHAGMIAPLLAVHYRGQSAYQALRTLFTIHNLHYQGIFAKTVLGDVLDLGWEHFTPEGIEFYDQVNFMKGGLMYADRISTVSRTYAEEIQTPFLGEMLDGVIRNRRHLLAGIINGIDYAAYNPATDRHLFVPYDAEEPHKGENKVKLQGMLDLPVNADTPLLAMVTRLVGQKGLDLLVRVLEDLLALDLQLVIVGSGEERYEGFLQYAGRSHPDKMSVHIGFDDQLARRVYAAADLFLMPSLFEPCGTAQLIALRYGCLPVVRETGGLKDTVMPYDEDADEGNGFTFTNYNAHDMLAAIKRALAFYRQPARWSRLVARAMRADHSWRSSARQYVGLYNALTAKGDGDGAE